MNIILPQKESENQILLENLNDNYVILARTIDMCYILKKNPDDEMYPYRWEEPQGTNPFLGLRYSSINAAVIDCHSKRQEAKFEAFLNRK